MNEAKILKKNIRTGGDNIMILAVVISTAICLPIVLVNFVLAKIDVNLIPIWIMMSIASTYPISRFVKNIIEPIEEGEEENDIDSVCDRTDK